MTVLRVFESFFCLFNECGMRALIAVGHVDKPNILALLHSSSAGFPPAWQRIVAAERTLPFDMFVSGCFVNFCLLKVILSCESMRRGRMGKNYQITAPKR